MKKLLFILFILVLAFSFVYAEQKEKTPTHGPTMLVPQAEIGGRAIGDDCTDPIIVSLPTALPYTDAGQTTCGRGNSYSDTPLGSYDGGEDIIYRLDVTADIFLDFEMIPDVSWTGLLIADDCPDVGNEVAMSTAYSGSHFIEGVELLAGNSYYVMMDTWPAPDCIPSFDFTIVEGTQVFPPDNDTCETAEVIGEVVDYAFNTTLATTSGFDTYSINQDIWYSYTPASDGTIYVGLCDTSFDTKLAVYGECDVATELGYNDDSCGLQSEIFDIEVVAGEDYMIQVGGYGSNSGTGLLDIVFTSSFVPEPPTNLFVDDTGYATWEAPGGGEELIYDNGVITGAYSYVGYSMGTQMSPAEACQILTLKIHTSEGSNFNAEVWGWDAGAPTEDLYYQENVNALMDDWVIVDVSGENLMFDGDFVVAFGSIDATTYMSFDGGLNNGRSWDHDDTGGWAAWSEAYLVRAIVQYGNGRIAEISPTPIKTNNVANILDVSSEKISIDVIDHNVDVSRDLTGYNVYLDDVLQDNTTDLEYQLTGLVNGEEYTAGVEAVYDEGVSDIVEITFTFTGTSDAGDVIIATTKLTGNYPNPFNPVTTIAYSTKDAGNVILEVYNLKGQLVKTLVNEVKETGNHTAIWNGTDNLNKSVSSGVYFYKMISSGKMGRYTSTKKMILMK